MSEVHMSFLFILHIQLLGKCFWFSSKELSYTQMKTYKVITREQRGIPRRIRMYPILMDPHGHHQQKPQSWIRINPPYIHTDPSWECHSILIWLVGQGHPSEKWWSSSIKGWWKKPNMNGKIKNWWQPNHQPVIQSSGDVYGQDQPTGATSWLPRLGERHGSLQLLRALVHPSVVTQVQQILGSGGRP